MGLISNVPRSEKDRRKLSASKLWLPLLPLWEKVSPKATDEGCSSLAKTVLRPTPLIRLGAARRSTFSHKGRRRGVAFIAERMELT
jgi:hypothetical protein